MRLKWRSKQYGAFHPFKAFGIDLLLTQGRREQYERTFNMVLGNCGIFFHGRIFYRNLYFVQGACFTGSGGGNEQQGLDRLRSGNTRELAGQIQTATGGKLVELEPVETYPAEYQQTVNRARQELASGACPPLKTKIDGMDAYDVILLGSPNWGGSIAPPVKTFLSEYDLSGKRIAPFMTHGGSGLGRASIDIKSLAPQATVIDGLAVRGREVREARREIETWIGGLGLHRD